MERESSDQPSDPSITPQCLHPTRCTLSLILTRLPQAFSLHLVKHLSSRVLHTVPSTSLSGQCSPQANLAHSHLRSFVFHWSLHLRPSHGYFLLITKSQLSRHRLSKARSNQSSPMNHPHQALLLSVNSAFFMGLGALSKHFIHLVIPVQSLPTRVCQNARQPVPSPRNLKQSWAVWLLNAVSERRKGGKKGRREEWTPPVDRGGRKGFMLCLSS